MGLKAKCFLLFLLVSLLSSIALGDRREEDRELQRCKQECQQRARYDAGKRRWCEVRCEEQHRRREEEQGGEGRREKGDEHNRRDPRERLEECLQECRQQQQQGREQRWKCEKRCQEQYKREEHEQQQGVGGNPEREPEREGEKKTGSKSPYFFEEEHFERAVSTEHGRVWLLKKFHEQSELLLGIANYRIAVFEMKPNTFELPVHCDADTILYVASGKGSIGILREEEEETHDIKHGDILRVRPGTIAYMANTDSNEKLYIIKLVKPIAVPTQVQAFYDVGGNPDSYLRSFSKDVLEAAYNTEAEEVERLFGKHKESFIKVSEEKMRAMTHRHRHEEGGRGPFFGHQSRKPFNIFSKRPSYSSDRGKLHEVNPEDCEDLRELDIKVSFLNLTSGSMLVPSYNTKLTTIAMVIDGKGCVEIVCPHVGGRKGERKWEEREKEQVEEGGRRREEGQQLRYQKISAEVSKGTVFVVPPGHPFVGAAYGGGSSSNENNNNNIQVVCFGIHARDNERIFLAGKNNVWKRMERAAKELAFGASVEEVDKLLNAQSESVFIAGPGEKREEPGRPGLPLSSILSAFANF